MSSDFWSRRKAAVEAEQREELRKLAQEKAVVRDEALAEKSDAEILEELGLPDPDTLGEGDDFKAFLTEEVPARIKTRALRKLWKSNPVLANVDGLVDYGEDFTDASCVIENLQTAYQVGKGMTAHVLEMARQAEDKADAETDMQPEQAAEADATPPVEAPEEAPAQIATAPAPLPAFDSDATEEDTPLPPRRMRFAFDDSGATA
ncbi:DUF3306 domain-containing protein [Shimia sp. SDUM112013]|uniref:DUF3306 domain-containing protein n=1 Tax=Shimia sp. SDUM112013 TaxID=3136160 RepID=UPI0032ED604A